MTLRAMHKRRNRRLRFSAGKWLQRQIEGMYNCGCSSCLKFAKYWQSSKSQ